MLARLCTAVSFVPMVLLGLIIIVKGGENGLSLSMFNPGETSLFGVQGGGVLGGVLLATLRRGLGAPRALLRPTSLGCHCSSGTGEGACVP